MRRERRRVYRGGYLQFANLRDGDLLETDYVLPRSQGGTDDYKNLQLLHRHCHDVKTALDGSIGMHDKHHIVEDLDAGKACTSGFEDQQVG